MIRIKSTSGEYFDTPADLTLEIERTNPFFNDYGEQSLTVTLPPTDRNKRLTGQADKLANVAKQLQRQDASIEAGVYCISAKMAVLSANGKNGIECCFYMNTGAFYEKMADVSLSDIFKDDVIQFANVSDAITFCRNLMITEDERFGIFPVSTSAGSLNLLNTTYASDGYPTLLNAAATTETVDETKISVPAGYWITPFIKVNYLLDRIFAYFGYTVNPNFFNSNEPFMSMVLLNNTMDTIVKGKIKFTDIIPDVNVQTFLNMFRKKFNCEFVSYEAEKAVTIRLLNDVIEYPPELDLTKYINGRYTVEHPETFLQLKLTCGHVDNPTVEAASVANSQQSYRTTEASTSNFGSLIELLAKFPKCYISPVSGEITRQGFCGVKEVVQRLGYLDQDYWAGGVLSAESVESPDVLPHMVYKLTQINRRTTVETSVKIMPFIGKARALNSQIILDTTNSTDADSSETISDSTAEQQTLSIMPCFMMRSKDGKFFIGSIYNVNDSLEKQFDYTLSYHGEDGLYERFWRKYDDILRNSKMEVKANMILPENLKMSLNNYKQVLIDGQCLMPNVIKFAPGKEIQEECSFYTTRLYTPVSSAITETERLASVRSLYRWNLTFTKSDTTKTKWKYESEPTTIFYDPPTEAEYTAGGQYHSATYPVTFYSREDESGNPTDGVSGTLATYLTPALNS